MKFTAGDKVVIKATQEDVSVFSVINEECVWIDNLNARHPVFEEELSLPEFQRFVSKKVNDKKSKMMMDDFEAEVYAPHLTAKMNVGFEKGFSFCLFPVFHRTIGYQEIAKFRVYFVNNTPHSLKLQYDCFGKEERLHQLGTTVNPYKRVFLHTIRIKDLNDQPRFQAIIQQHGDKTKADETTLSHRTKSKHLFEQAQKIERKENFAIKYHLAEDFPDAYKFEGTSKNIFTSKRVPTNYIFLKQAETQEPTIDLHIEKLIKNHIGLDNFEILTVQLAALEEAIQKAISKRQHSLVVIHGVGTGKLREEVHQYLKEHKKNVKHFENKFSSKYGFGATEVFFKF